VSQRRFVAYGVVVASLPLVPIGVIWGSGFDTIVAMGSLGVGVGVGWVILRLLRRQPARSRPTTRLRAAIQLFAMFAFLLGFGLVTGGADNVGFAGAAALAVGLMCVAEARSAETATA